MIRRYIENRREEIINDLLELVRIPSVSYTPECVKMLNALELRGRQNKQRVVGGIWL